MISLSGIFFKIFFDKDRSRNFLFWNLIPDTVMLSLFLIFVINIFMYYSKEIKHLSENPNKKLGQSLFIINYFYNPIILLFLLALYVFRWKAHIRDGKREYIILFSILINLIHILMHLNYYSYLKNTSQNLLFLFFCR